MIRRSLPDLIVNCVSQSAQSAHTRIAGRHVENDPRQGRGIMKLWRRQNARPLPSVEKSDPEMTAPTRR
jgi:hypothetical protein